MTRTPPAAAPPPAPPGYQPAVRFEYPKYRLQAAALLLLAVITPVLLLLTGVLQTRSGGGVGIRVRDWTDLALTLAVVLTTTSAHELMHGLAYQWFGYQVRYGASWHLLAAYAAAFGQWQKRDHNLVVALAPLVVLDILLLPLLAVGNHAVVLGALTALMMNTAGAAGDLYLAGRLLRLPRTTLLYDVDARTMWIYTPVKG